MNHKCPQEANPTNCIPFSRKMTALKERLFNVTGLFPYTLYEVRVIAFNAFTSVESLTQQVRTLSEGKCLAKLSRYFNSLQLSS